MARYLYKIHLGIVVVVFTSAGRNGLYAFVILAISFIIFIRLVCVKLLSLFFHFNLIG